MDLPLAPRLEEIRETLREKGALVLRADPGSGKSTLVPLALLGFPDDAGRIVVLEPRRAAALGIASRMAELLGEPLGERVGYAVRLERKLSSRTRIEVITEGLLVRRLQNDPTLTGVSTVIFDEFHERSIHTDLSLALVMDLRRMGSKLSILVMSATMDAVPVAGYIDAAEGRSGNSATPVIQCPGRVFPVDIRYRPPVRKTLSGFGGEDPFSSPELPVSGAASAIRELLEEIPGDILVFLPGRREIAALRTALTRGPEPSFRGKENSPPDIFSLHGGLPLEKQREILAPSKNGRRRIILSTNVAETGLTIPGVRAVVDTGRARISRYHLSSGMNRIVLENIRLQSADQRAGRAGRLGPGICVRLWSPGDIRPGETDPEIRRSDLSALVLECLLWGVRNREDLPWFETPPPAAWERGFKLLEELGAIAPGGGPGRKSREMAGLGLEPRLASLCIAARDRGLAPLGCATAAVLSDRDCPGLGDEADFRERLSLLRSVAPGDSGGSVGADGRAGCGKNVSRDTEKAGWINRTLLVAGDLLRRLRTLPKKGDDNGITETGLKHRAAFSWTAEEEAGAGELLGAAFPDRIGRRGNRPSAGSRRGPWAVYRFVSGREARLEGPLAYSEWIVATEADAGERTGYIRTAAPLSAERALEILGNSITVESHVEWKGLVPRGVTIKKAGAILLLEERRQAGREEILPALAALLEEKGIGILPWDEEGGSRRLLERIQFFAARGRLDAAVWSGRVLASEAAQWIGPFIREGGGPAITGRELAEALAGRLDWEKKRELDRLVPDHLDVPGARRKPFIEYTAGEPLVRIPLQDAFGIKGKAEVLGTPVVFHLLSPAGRPVQITRDLEGFWKGSYTEVRKEMRARYPKHDWP
jgi:ATP-dependent helicase HrpB